jgi:hypothetical protein
VPRRTLLTAVERASLLALPSQESDWIRHYHLSETDLSVVRSRRGAHNRLGFAVQLCLLRYPGIVLARSLVETLRREQVIVPAVEVVERACAEALTLGTRRVYAALTRPLLEAERERLGSLLEVRDGTRFSTLAWLRQPPGSVFARNILQHLERLQAIHALALPEGLTAGVHQNRWMKLAREGTQMTGQHLRDLEVRRREATLVAVVLETRAALIDETIELHERMLGSLFSRARRRHAEEFQQAGRSINEKVRLRSTWSLWPSSRRSWWSRDSASPWGPSARRTWRSGCWP